MFICKVNGRKENLTYYHLENLVYQGAIFSVAYSLIFVSYLLRKVVFNSSVLRIDFD